MSICMRSGRYLAAALAICCTAFLGFTSVGWADSHSLNRQQAGKLVEAAQPALQARIAQRHHLRRVARRACSSHRRKLCAHAHTRLTRRDGQAARLRKSALTQQRRVHASAPTGPAAKRSSLSQSADFSAADPGSSSAGTGTGSPPAGGATTPPWSGPGSVVQSPSSAEAPAASSAFQPGIDGGTNMTLDLQGAVLLGAKLVRVEFPIDTSPAQMEAVIAGYAAKGIRVLPLASFYGRLPSPAEARGLASWVAAYGPGGTFWADHTGGQFAIQSIEFGNETSYGYQYGDNAGSNSYRERAENYARRLQESAEAIAATGIHVGLLAQADDWTGDWMSGMYAAVPNLSSYVGGWTIHPYHHWRSRLEALLEQTAAHGAPATIPIDITEWGLPTDAGHCIGEDEEYNGCMSYDEAGAILRETTAGIKALLGSQLGMFILYQVRDQQLTGASTDDEEYYGALQHELQPKGEYTTAIQALLASA